MIDHDLRADLERSFAAAFTDDPSESRGRLIDAGWLDALDADEAVATAILFRLQGDRCRDAAALDDVLWRPFADGHPEAAAGTVAVALPVAAATDGRATTHVVHAAHRDASRLLWPLDPGGQRLLLVDLDGPLAGRAVSGIDPAMAFIGLDAVPPGAATELDDDDATDRWDEAVLKGRIALAHQMVAGANALLALAVRYAGERRQFGTPIGTFQAVKHRLAETFVAIAAADAATTAAASSPTPTGAVVAKVLAGRAAATAGRNCLQVFGGIGFTVEHEFHHVYRRNLVLDRLLGDQRSLERQLGRDIREGALRGERVIELDVTPHLELLAIPTSGGPAMGRT